VDRSGDKNPHILYKLSMDNDDGTTTHVEVDRYQSHLNVLIRMTQFPGQTGHCGNFNGDPDDDQPSQDMIPDGESIFPTKVWGNIIPRESKCAKKVYDAAVGACAAKFGIGEDADKDNVNSCVIDYCSLGSDVAMSSKVLDDEAKRLGLEVQAANKRKAYQAARRFKYVHNHGHNHGHNRGQKKHSHKKYDRNVKKDYNKHQKQSKKHKH